MRSFRSDNNAGICPEALRAMHEANERGHVIGYGDDAYTRQAIDAFRAVFGEHITVYFVATGSAANTLAIASLTQPWQQVLCHAHSHLNNDESTAPERLTHCRVTAIHTEHSKLMPKDLQRFAAYSRGDVHQPQPGVLTISNSTEFGTVYSPSEVRELCQAAHEAGFAVHVDGARFGNAVASFGCDPRELAGEAGIDALSFGGTKNGLALGEAVLFFPQGDGTAHRRAVSSFAFHRKATGHLLSKHRFVSAPFAAMLCDGAWLRHASHANQMAAALAAGLRDAGLQPRFDVQANGVFVALPKAIDAALRAAGHQYYPFGDPSWGMVRLMCSYDTRLEEVQALLADVRRSLVRR